MHTKAYCCLIDIFSVESGKACITGLVKALSDHFTSVFVTWEQNLLCLKKEIQSQAAFSITFLQSDPAERRKTRNIRPCLPDQQDLQMNV